LRSLKMYAGIPISYGSTELILENEIKKSGICLIITKRISYWLVMIFRWVTKCLTRRCCLGRTIGWSESWQGWYGGEWW
jgi:hypothetical protein